MAGLVEIRALFRAMILWRYIVLTAHLMFAVDIVREVIRVY